MFNFIKNIGGPELVIIVIVLIVLFGDKKVKKISRGLGKSAKEFKKVKKEFGVAETDIGETIKELKQGY